MKILKALFAVFILAGSIQMQAQTEVEKKAFSPSFRYCPDRDYDLAWENDLVAFRVYGWQANPEDGLSGVDCWHKKVSYPIVDKWYKGYVSGTASYHEDRGEGCDQYHVGKSRGCGGVGIWKDDQVLRSGLYESWEVTSITQTSISIQLTYSWTIDGEKIVETRDITLDNGSQLYSAVSHFTKNGYPIKNLEVVVGLSTQNGTAEVKMNKEEGWLAAWHGFHEEATGHIGVGAIVDTNELVDIIEQKSKEADDSHVLAILKTDGNGAIHFKAGFAWDQAGAITSMKQWSDYLHNY